MSTSTADGNRRPGRPASFDRRDALDQLLVLFWRKGYDGATQDEMLTATGLSSSTLFRSFGNKADILQAVLACYSEHTAALFGPLEHGVGGVADLQNFFDSIEQWLRGPMGPAGCLVVETIQNPINTDPQVRALTDQHLGRLQRSVHAAVTRAVDAGELACTPQAFAEALRAGVLGVLSRARTGDIADALELLAGVRSLLP